MENDEVNDDDEKYFGEDTELLEEEIKDLKEKKKSQLNVYWMRFKRNKLALAGLGIVIALIIAAIFAPLLAPYDPYSTDATSTRVEPSLEHPFGTDQVGRDTLSRLIYGSRIALLIGVLIVAVAGSIGVTLGLVAGVMGGWVDEVIMRVVDAFMAFPILVFAAALAVALGMGLYPVIIAVGLIIWTRFARVVRGDVISLKQEQFIEGAYAIGESKWNLVTKYYLPNILPSIAVVGTIILPQALIYSATLSFLGIGAQEPTASWGLMVRAGSRYLGFYPYQAIFSGLAIIITVLGFNFIGDGLRDALDPVRGGK